MKDIVKNKVKAEVNVEAEETSPTTEKISFLIPT
jgi:hypothetical protein